MVVTVHRRARGATLLELIAVILVMAVISVVVYPRFTQGDTASVQAGRDQVLAAVSLAQQLAMARSAQDNPVQLTLAAHRIDVTEGGQSVSVHADAYPEELPSGVDASAVTLTFDKLGRTTPATITLDRGDASATVQVEATGYAH